MPPTLDDFADHLNMPDGPPPVGDRRRVEMQRALDTAVQEITRRTGMPGDATVTASIPTVFGDRVLMLPYVRLAAVGVIRDPGGVPTGPLILDVRGGIVWLPIPTSGGVWSVDVTGVPWPAALDTAALDWATHIYDTQRTVTAPVSDTDTPAPSFALPNRVAELLTPYTLPGVA